MADEVSWQSAFWCTVAVALNTMSQPSGNILGIPGRYNFYIRASPIICGWSAVVTAGFFILESIRRRSILEAAMVWEARRFWDRPNATTGSFEDLRKNTIFRLIMFFLGALMPSIKIYSCTGIFKTQLLCSCYLASFLIDELLAALCYHAKKTPTYPGAYQWSTGSDKSYLEIASVIWIMELIAMVTYILQISARSFPSLDKNALPEVVLFVTFPVMWLPIVKSVLRGRGGALLFMILVLPLTAIPAALFEVHINRPVSGWLENRLYESKLHIALGLAAVSVWTILPFALLAWAFLRVIHQPTNVIMNLLDGVNSDFDELKTGPKNANAAEESSVMESSTPDDIASRREKFKLQALSALRISHLNYARIHAVWWLAIGICYYGIEYDASTTHQPRWLRVFG